MPYSFYFMPFFYIVYIKSKHRFSSAFFANAEKDDQHQQNQRKQRRGLRAEITAAEKGHAAFKEKNGTRRHITADLHAEGAERKIPPGMHQDCRKDAFRCLRNGGKKHSEKEYVKETDGRKGRIEDMHQSKKARRDKRRHAPTVPSGERRHKKAAA